MPGDTHTGLRSASCQRRSSGSGAAQAACRDTRAHLGIRSTSARACSARRSSSPWSQRRGSVPSLSSARSSSRGRLGGVGTPSGDSGSRLTYLLAKTNERLGEGRRGQEVWHSGGGTCRSRLEETHLVTAQLSSVTHPEHKEGHPRPSSAAAHSSGVTHQAPHAPGHVSPLAGASPAYLRPPHEATTRGTWLPRQ